MVSFVPICLSDNKSCLHSLLAGKLIPRKDSIVAQVHISLPAKCKQGLFRQVICMYNFCQYVQLLQLRLYRLYTAFVQILFKDLQGQGE